MHILFLILYQPLLNALVFLYNLLPGHDMGIAIILLTIIIRLLLWPANAKSLKSQRELQVLQPELDRIRKKYPDKTEQSQKMMEFYKEYKINPFSSCLPLLIQFPILIAMYQVFRNILTKSSALKDLYPFIHNPGVINPHFLGFLDLSRPDKFVLPILAGAFQLWQARMVMGRQPKPVAGEQPGMASMMSKQMLYMMPLMTIVISMSLPAALPIYWIVTTIVTIIQQYFLFKTMPALPADSNSKPATSVKKESLLGRFNILKTSPSQNAPKQITQNKNRPKSAGKTMRRGKINVKVRKRRAR